MEPEDKKQLNNQDQQEQQNDNNNEMQVEEQQRQGQANQEQQQEVSEHVDQQVEMQDQHDEEQEKQVDEDQEEEQNDEQQQQANKQKKSPINQPQNQIQNQMQSNIQQMQQNNIKKPEDIIWHPKEQILQNKSSQNKNKQQKINKANQLQEKLKKLKQQKQKKQAQAQAQAQNKQNKQQLNSIFNQQQNTPPQFQIEQQQNSVQALPQASLSSTPQIHHPTSQPPSQKYLNHLELQLSNSQKTLSQTISKLNSQTNITSFMTSNNKLLSSTLAQKNKQNANLQQQIRHKAQQISQKDIIIQQLKQQLSLYRQIGDVKSLKIRVQQLESLVQVLKKQIQIKNLHKNQMIKDGQRNQEQEYNKFNKLGLRDLITQFEKVQNEKQNIQARVIQLQHLITLKNKQLTQNLQIMNKIDQQLKLSMQKCINLQTQHQSLTTIYTSQKSILQQKITNLQSSFQNIKLKSYQFHTNNQQKQQQKQKQKDILFRQYLKIQLQYKQQQDQLKQIKIKYQQVCKDIRIIKKQMVSRKDYQEVFVRYKKCKQCLQKVIVDNKKLSRRQIQSQDMIEQKNININYLNQQQNNIKKYFQVFNHHVQQSIDYFKQTNSLLENNQFQKLTTDIKSAQLLISELVQKNTRLQKLNTIFQNQLVYKNSLLDRVIADSKNIKQQYYRLQQEKLNIQENYVQNVSAKSALRRLETKASGLLLINRKILEQKQQWKNLYENIKQKDPNFQQQHEEQKLQEDKKGSQKQIKQGQIQAQSTKIIPKPTLSTIETQTQGLNQLYYKQIKQTLSAVKKFPQSIKSATKNFQNISLQLQEYKKRYDQVNQKYNIKFRTLQNQKNQNDSWRQTTRKQIINQFQQIRQFIEDGRLLSCLRKAKNLIEYLEQGGEEEGQVIAE